MNRMKRIIAVISAICMTFSGIPVSGADTAEEIEKPVAVVNPLMIPQSQAVESSGRCGLNTNWEISGGVLTIS